MADGRHLQILVHQISSSDLVLCTPVAACAKPQYMHYADVTDLLLSRLATDAQRGVSLLTADTDASVCGPQIPIGIKYNTSFELDRSQVALRDDSTATMSAVPVTGLLFPVVAAMIPVWMKELQSRTRARQAADGGLAPRRIVYLISGPSVQAGPEHESAGSTDGIALLLTRFMRVAYPEILTCVMDGEIGTDRYDAQVQFIKHALSPHIDLQRSHLVDHYADEWASRFSLAISMATGSPARLAAINASLRQYQPAYMHLPLVKSFFWDGDFHAQLQSIQYITFDSVEGTPPVPVSEVDEECRALVEEIRAYAERFLRVVQARRRAKPTSSEQPHLIPWVSAGGGAPAESIPTVPALSRGGSGDTLDGNPDGEEGDYDHELMDFWLRKTRKPVLAVVLVRRGTNPHAERRYFRAMNLEVSMPTGSLCSERAAIAQALASDPGLRRSDIRMVAVLSLPKLEHPDSQVRSAYQAAGLTAEQEIYHDVGGSGEASALLPPLLPRVRTPPPPERPDKEASSAEGSSFTPPEVGANLGAPNAEHDGKALPSAQRQRLFSPPLPLRDSTAVAASANPSFSARQKSAALRVVEPGSGNSPPRFAATSCEPIPHMHVTPESAVAALLLTEAGSDGTSIEAFAKSESARLPAPAASDIALPAPAVGAPPLPVPVQARARGASNAAPATVSSVPVALNPLAPCGSCMEWLRKLAEANPDFKILSFTDISCAKVFIKPVLL